MRISCPHCQKRNDDPVIYAFNRTFYPAREVRLLGECGYCCEDFAVVIPMETDEDIQVVKVEEAAPSS